MRRPLFPSGKPPKASRRRAATMLVVTYQLPRPFCGFVRDEEIRKAVQITPIGSGTDPRTMLRDVEFEFRNADDARKAARRARALGRVTTRTHRMD